jgi:hypothetical protein
MPRRQYRFKKKRVPLTYEEMLKDLKAAIQREVKSSRRRKDKDGDEKP